MTIALNNIPTEAQAKHWAACGYSPEAMQHLARFESMLNQQKTKETADVILDYVHNKSYTKERLTFKQWFVNCIVCRNKKGKEHVIIGSFWGGRYVLRGIVKRQSPGRRFTWLSNGQANMGASQVAHIGENDEANDMAKLTKTPIKPPATDYSNYDHKKEEQKREKYIVQFSFSSLASPKHDSNSL
jgi:hypothetical protein